MGRLIDGKWSTHDLGADEKGRYVRRATQFRSHVTAEPDAEYPAESGRYHLYVSSACGWSHRTMIFRIVLESSATKTFVLTEIPFFILWIRYSVHQREALIPQGGQAALAPDAIKRRLPLVRVKQVFWFISWKRGRGQAR